MDVTILRNHHTGAFALPDKEGRKNTDPASAGCLQRFAKNFGSIEIKALSGALLLIGAGLCVFGTPIGALVGIGFLAAGAALLGTSTAVSVCDRPDGESIVGHIAKSIGCAILGAVSLVIAAGLVAAFA